MFVQIRKLEPALADDFFRFFEEIAFADHPEWGCGCYCCFFHATDKKVWESASGTDNRASAREMILTGRLSGLLAYVDGQPAAWCHYDLRDNLPGIRTFYPEWLAGEADDEQIASVVCFTVAQNRRGQGLAGRLLTAACDDLRIRGVRVAEAYPIAAAADDEQHYHGPLSLYLKNGFAVYREWSGGTIVRKDL